MLDRRHFIRTVGGIAVAAGAKLVCPLGLPLPRGRKTITRADIEQMHEVITINDPIKMAWWEIRITNMAGDLVNKYIVGDQILAGKNGEIIPIVPKVPVDHRFNYTVNVMS